MGQMKHIIALRGVPFGTETEALAALLSGAAQELEQAKKLLLLGGERLCRLPQEHGGRGRRR